MTASNTAALADAYAALKFEEERIAARIKTLREEIISVGEKELVGDTVIVALVEKKGSETLDKSAALFLLKELGATPEQIASLTKVGKPSTSLLIKPKLAAAL